MHRRAAHLRRFLRSEDGPTTAEYAVMLVFVLGAIIFAVQAFGQATSALWGSDTNQINTATGS